jgi:DNA-binding MarR family transcriptional regulator
MPVLPSNREACVCSTLRAASRFISQLYDDALAPLGLSITSYALLGKIDGLGRPSMNELAEAAAMDRSTLSRNLKPLLDAKLIAVTSGADRRRKEFSITPSGRTTLTAAYPKWQDVQIRFRRAYGATEAKHLTAMLGRVLTLQA